MKNIALRSSVLCALTVAVISMAGAQIVSAPKSMHRDFLNLKAARRDIRHLQADRRRALRYGNTSKVAQDDRLIAADRFWIKRYQHRIKSGG